MHLLTKESSLIDKISLLVESLSGVIVLSKKYDDKNDYANYLTKKFQKKENIFVDLDVILDLLAKREPFYKYSAKIIYPR